MHVWTDEVCLSCPYLHLSVFPFSVHVQVYLYVTSGACVCVPKHMRLVEVSEHYGAGQQVQRETAVLPNPPFQSAQSCDYGSQT